MKKNVGGRPAVPGDKRDKLVAFYLTKVDFATLAKAASAGGFKGTSTLLTALVEPILHGGLSVEAAARSVNRIQKHMESNGAKFSVSIASLIKSGKDLFAPPPPIPDDVEDLSKLKADLRALLAELENQTTTNTSK